MPQQIEIKAQSINKIIPAPGSKSVMQRIVAGAVLSNDKTTIINPSFCDDCKVALKIAEDLGCELIYENNKIHIFPGKKEIKTEINCGESGLGIRMFTPIISLFGKEVIIYGEGSLKNRPLKAVEDALNQSGVKCKTNSGSVPVSVSGKIKGGSFEIDGYESSQILTGLLFALPKAENDSIIKVNNLKSKPYIDLTLSILKDFGIIIENENYRNFKIKGNQIYKSGEVTIEGDWSGAAFLLVAGLIAGEVKVTGLDLKSKQADKQIINAIQAAGGKISVKENEITCKKSSLKAFQFDASDCPDLFPPLAAMASYCKGTSMLKGAERLIHKESNRAKVLQTEFKKIGINIIIDKDLMLIEGGKVKGGITDSNNDHRIAMALGIAALQAENPVIIKNPDSINKSYPDFYKNLLGIS